MTIFFPESGRMSHKGKGKQSEKSHVFIPVGYEEAGFHYKFECDSETPMGNVMRSAAAKGMVSAREQLNIDSTLADWNVMVVQPSGTAGEFVASFPDETIRMTLKPGVADRGLMMGQKERLKKFAESVQTDLDTATAQIAADLASRIATDAKIAADFVPDTCRKSVQLEVQISDQAAQISYLMQFVNMQYHIARRICILDARQKVIERIGKAQLHDQSWNAYMGMLTAAERAKADITDPIWNKLTTGVRAGNFTAHVAAEEVIAQAICSISDSRDVWKAIFKLAYGKDAEEIVFAV